MDIIDAIIEELILAMTLGVAFFINYEPSDYSLKPYPTPLIVLM